MAKIDLDVLRRVSRNVGEVGNGSMILASEYIGLAADEIAALRAELEATQKRARAAERDLASVAMCATCKHADNDVCDATCGDSDSTYRWEWRGPDAGGESGESGEVVGDDDVHVAPSLDRSVGPD